MLLYDLLMPRIAVAPRCGCGRATRFWFPARALGWLRLRALGGALPGFEAVSLTTVELAINAVALVPRYVATFLWPVDLNMYHDFDAIHSVWHGRFVAGLGVLVLSALMIVACWRRHAVVSFGVAWMLVTVSPHLLARWPQLNVFAERYLYMPAVGAFLIAAYALQRVPRRGVGTLPVPRRAAEPAVALAVLLAIIDVRRSADNTK
jgi:hypothetical protein